MMAMNPLSSLPLSDDSSSTTHHFETVNRKFAILKKRKMLESSLQPLELKELGKIEVGGGIAKRHCLLSGSNTLPWPLQGHALPDELRRLIFDWHSQIFIPKLLFTPFISTLIARRN